MRIPLRTLPALLMVPIVLAIASCDDKVDDLFELNKLRQEEGYYMGEFEFKMLGIGMLAGQGRMIRAGVLINRLHNQLKYRKGLIKIPSFESKEEEIAFYLDLQNPATGAFMDDRYPYCTFDEPTHNVLNLIDALLEEGEPLELKHPLTYLEKIDTPAELLDYLEQVTYVTEDELDYPQTSFHFARTVLGHLKSDVVYKKHNLFPFSPEWEETVLDWFCAIQDSETGFWGPLVESTNELGSLDLNNTASIVKAFVDKEGEDIYPSYPLQHRSQLIQTALEVMTEQGDDEEMDLSEWHEWTLKMGKGIKMLTSYLLHKASDEDKDKTRAIVLDYLQNRYTKCYVEDEGAFSYYPDAEHASLDGAGMVVGLYNTIGSFSPDKQAGIWSSTLDPMTDLTPLAHLSLSDYDFGIVDQCADANSFRFYSKPFEEPDDSVYQVDFVYYPSAPLVLDVTDVFPKLEAWLDDTSLGIGNWTSRESLSDNLAEHDLDTVPVYTGAVPVAAATELFDQSGTLTIIGYDIIQVPICGVTITSDGAAE